MGYREACQAWTTSWYVHHCFLRYEGTYKTHAAPEHPPFIERSGAHRILSIATRGHQPGGHGPEGMLVTSEPRQKKSDVESVGTDHDHHGDEGITNSPIATILGVAILEFGVALNRYVLELSFFFLINNLLHGARSQSMGS